ncbi:MAG: hypothetical protein DMF64_02885 [Acidobacteria bacterium]|nr:MAG: hypothetical protein DMF64_02885 [Acidobacteriota bacterium]
MRKRIYAALFVLLFLATHVCAQSTGQWIKFAPTAGGFSILLPSQPKEETGSKDNFTSHLFTAKNERAIYVVGYGDYAPSMHLNVDDELLALRDNFVRNFKAHLNNSRNVTLNQYPGLEFTAESDQASFKCRVYLAGNRVYRFAAIVFAGKDDTENVNKFLGSVAFNSNR